MTPNGFWRANRGLQLLLLALLMASGAYARTAMSPLQEAIRERLVLTDSQMAILQGPALGMPLVALLVPLGWLSDRMSRASLLRTLAAVCLVGCLLTAAAHQFWALLLGRALAGIGGLATYPIALSMLSDLYGADERGRSTMAVALGQVAGNALAFAIGGTLLEAFHPDPEGWRFAMLWMTALCATGSASVLLLREPDRRARVGSVARPRPAQALWAHKVTLGPLMIGLAMIETGIGAVLIWAAPALERLLHAGAQRIGAVLAMSILVSGSVGPVIGGVIADRCQRAPRAVGRTAGALCALAVIGAPLGLFSLAPDVATAGILLCALMTFMTAAAVMGTSLFTIVIPGEVAGLGTSLLIGIDLFAALGCGPPVVSTLSTALGGGDHVGGAMCLVLIAASLLAATSFAVFGLWGIAHIPVAS